MSKLELLVKRIKDGEVELYTEYYVECARLLSNALAPNPPIGQMYERLDNNNNNLWNFLSSSWIFSVVGRKMNQTMTPNPNERIAEILKGFLKMFDGKTENPLKEATAQILELFAEVIDAMPERGFAVPKVGTPDHAKGTFTKLISADELKAEMRAKVGIE